MKGNFKEKNLKHSCKLVKLESDVSVMSAIKNAYLLHFLETKVSE